MKLLQQLVQTYWLVLTVVLLVGCTDNASQTSDVTNTDTVNSANATSAEPDKAAPPSEDLSEEPARLPLDLNLDPSDIKTNRPEDNIELNLEKQSGLPNFFAEPKSQKQKKKIAVGAKILTDPAVEKNYIESAKGAEIKVEIQTGKQKPR